MKYVPEITPERCECKTDLRRANWYNWYRRWKFTCDECGTEFEVHLEPVDDDSEVDDDV